MRASFVTAATGGAQEPPPSGDVDNAIAVSGAAADPNSNSWVKKKRASGPSPTWACTYHRIPGKKVLQVRARIDEPDVVERRPFVAGNGCAAETRPAWPEQEALKEAARIVKAHDDVVPAPSCRRFTLCEPAMSEKRKSVAPLVIGNVAAVGPSSSDS